VSVLEGQRITVLGGGLSGRSAASLAKRLGARVILSDLSEDCPPLEGVDNHMGGHPEEILDVDLLVVSPGIPARVPAVVRAQELGVEVTSELGFASGFLPPNCPVIGITGTNGKSTVTSFVSQLFGAADWKVFAGGNLGTPLSDAVGKDWDVIVVEVSSYQMELPGRFSPSVAAVLNLTPDHLARHGSMEVYAEHKMRLLGCLREDGVGVLPASDAHLDAHLDDLSCRVLRFDSPTGFELNGDKALIDGDEILLSDLEVPGLMNRWNAAAACLLARLGGLPSTSLQPSSLRALPHRMQTLSVNSPYVWINDSKATNVEATLAGVSGLDGEVVLLLGGAGKDGADYPALRALYDGPVVHAVAFGASAPEISAALVGLPVTRADGLVDAIDKAEALACPGALVVLSPACASFDEFDDFSHRGRVFESLVESKTQGDPVRRNA